MSKLTAIKSRKELNEVLDGTEGLVGMEQGLQVYSKRNNAWTRANLRPKSVEKIIDNIFGRNEETFEELPKIAVLFNYEGTEEEYKPAVIVFTVSYENAMRKIESNDYALIIKRVSEKPETEEDGVISNMAASAFTIVDEEEKKEEKAVKPTKKGGKQ